MTRRRDCNLRKLVFYIDSMKRGGAQRVMMNLCEHFAENSYQVVLINDYPSDENESVYKLSPIIKRVYLQPKYTRNPIVNNVIRIVKLRRILKYEKPDIALSFLAGPNIRLLLSATGLKQKTAVSVRNDPNKEYAKSGIKKAIARKLFELADGCVFQTEEARAYFTERVRQKSAVILNPVDEKFYKVKRRPQAGLIVTAGRLVKQKRQDVLISAFKLIEESNPEAQLLIYGEGPLMSQLVEQINTLELNKRVSLQGNISDIEDALSKGSVFVLTSDYEGMPNALMEAMAVGLPCISTDCPCGGPRELEGGTESIMLVECGDINGIVHSLNSILKDNAYSEKLGISAKERANYFKDHVIYEKWERYLETICGKSV